MKSYRESLYVTLSHGTQNDSKTFKITKWDKVRQSGTCLKNYFKNKKKNILVKKKQQKIIFNSISIKGFYFALK